MRPFALVLVGSLAIALLFLTLPVAAIFLDTSPGRAVAQPGRGGRARRAAAEPGLLDARRWRSSSLFGTPAGVAAGDAALPRPRAGDHAGRAAARAAAGRGRDRAAGGARAAGRASAARSATGSCSPRRASSCALTFVVGAVLHAPGAGGVRGARPDAGWTPRARSARRRRARSRGSRSPRRGPGLLAGRRARLGPRAGRVRRHADVRGLLPRASRRRCRWRSTSASAPTSPSALALSAVLVGRVGGAAARRSSCSAARDGSAVLRVEARATLGALALDVALTVDAGRCLALAGPSGAGKTLDPARRRPGCCGRSAGVVACGEEVWLDTARGIDVAPERRGCGYVFQDYALFGHLRAWQNVAYPLTGLPRRAAPRARAGAARALRDRRAAPTRARARCRAASASAWRWPGRWRAARGRCCSTSRCRRSTRARARRPAASWPACCATPACPRCSSRTTSRRRRCSATRSAVVDGGRIVQRGDAGAARRRAGVGVRRRLHRRGRADRRRAPDRRARRRRSSSTAAAVVTALDRATGPVAVSVYPWEIALAPEHAADPGSARNHLDASRSSRSPRSATASGSAWPRRSRSPPSSPTPPCASSSCGPARAPWRHGRRRRPGCCR